MYISAKTINTSRLKLFFLLVGFLFLWLIVDRIVSVGLEKALLNSNFRISKIYKGDVQAQILILGNSRGVNGFYAPKIEEDTGLKTLNLSYNGLSIATARLLLEDYLEYNSVPKILLYEVTNLNVGKMSDNILQLYSGISPRMQENWEKSNPYFAYVQKFVAQTNRYNGELFLRALYYTNKSDQNWINRYQISDAFVENYVAGEAAKEWTIINPVAKEELIKIRSICVAHGIEFVPVITPIAPILFREIEEYENWVAEIEALIDQPIIDFGREIGELKYFADPVHMNLNGFNELYPALREHIFKREGMK